MDQLIQSRHYTIWQLIKAYWQSSQKLRVYFIFSIVMLMTIVLVGLDVVFNYWYNYFYNALQAYDRPDVIHLLIIFFILAAFYIVVSVYRFYISQLFGLRWRRWLTEQFIERWLQNRGYYNLENFYGGTDNPDQRIQEDIGSLVNYSFNLSIGFISAVATFFAFIYILWKLSYSMTLPLGSLGVFHIPGYLAWVAIIYCSIGSYFTFKIGHPLIPLNFEQQRREATFRYAAVNLRTHSEDIALYRGERNQQKLLGKIFNGVLDNWYMIILRQKLLLWFTSGYNQTSVLLPFLIALPAYFDKIFLLGGLIQTIQAFGRIQDALSFFINSYTDIAQWRAVGLRLTTFLNHMHDIDTKNYKENKFNFIVQPENNISLKDVSVYTPQGDKLLVNINEEFIYGRDYLINGVSGIGKSTLIRAIAGIWPYGIGEIHLPKQQKIMYLPQKPYMPLGTLADAILFPDTALPSLESQIENILIDCKLDKFIGRLKETAAWSEQLSPGELQRITFARILLHKPDWVFLDESTSMLDLPSEKYLYQLLKVKLPHCSLISIGHHIPLDMTFDKIINIEKYIFK